MGTVKKVFLILITVVALILLGAFVLNILMPNTVTQVVSSIEDGIYKATGISMNLNGDNHSGGSNANNTYSSTVTSNNDDISGGVDGFQ